MSDSDTSPEDPLTPDSSLLDEFNANSEQLAKFDVHQAESVNFASSEGPEVLWIGCSDYRVPESVLHNTIPSHVFVHRNIANQFHPNDDNVLSVLQFAVASFPSLRHIVVVGHTDCKGVAECYHVAQGSPPQFEGPLRSWLQPLTDFAKDMRPSNANDLMEANVRTQANNIASTPVLKDAWRQGRQISVRGWIYEVEKHKLRDLLKISRPPAT